MTASQVVDDLLRLASETELAKLRKRLPEDETSIGLRMGDLFAVAKAHRDLPLGELELLLDQVPYEPRMAAFCILDFKAQRRLTEGQQRELYEIYLRRHDRITAWDMVDRAAPRVVGGYLAGRDLEPLHRLSRTSDPLRRRTAITAPLFFTRAGSEADLTGGFVIAARLAADPVPVVHNAVGIFLKHAGGRDLEALHRFLGEHAATMPRPALRLATEKLSPAERIRYREP